jgi:hypothetical protein
MDRVGRPYPPDGGLELSNRGRTRLRRRSGAYAQALCRGMKAVYASPRFVWRYLPEILLPLSCAILDRRADDAGVIIGYMAGLGGELPGLLRAPSLVATPARGHRGPSLPGCTVDETDGPGRSGARQGGEDHGEQPIGAVSARPCKAPVPGTGAKRCVGVGFHLGRHLAGLCLCCLRHRHVYPTYRRLASLTLARADFALEPTSCSTRSSRRSGIAVLFGRAA